MENLLLKAATTATTDRGEFTAIAAAYSVDRVKDRIIPGAFKNTIDRWRQSGKQIPLHWNHEGDPKSIIGSVDPASMRETDSGLYVEGKLDLADSEIAREAWRSMKNGSMSLSFGYVVDKARKATGGITELLQIDLFEVSIVPAPANADTRVLSIKSLVDEEIFDQAELQAAIDGDLKAVWTAAYINDLPDSAFLYIESGGEKDSEGKTTPRSLRHFPVKDANGSVDMPHLRNALSRIPQSDLPQDVKDRCTAMAQRMLDAQKSADAGKETKESRPADPLKETALKSALAVLTEGAEPPKVVTKEKPKQVPELDPDELRKQSRDLMLTVLIGTEVT